MKKIFLPFIALVFSLALPAQALAASLSLSPATGTFNAGCSFSLDIVLDTASAATDGTDAILFYDATKFTANNITNGTIFADYPGNNIDAPTGKITVSGLASVTQPFTGKGTLATINFTVPNTATAGVAQVNFDFDPNNKAKTTDSNVVERGTVVDLLSSVTNGNFTIGTGSCGSQGSSSGTTLTGVKTPVGGIATPSGEFKTLPSAGSEKLTFTLAIVGTVLTILGTLGLVLL